MGITSDYSPERIQRETEAQVDKIYERIIAAFMRAGEDFVKNAREQGQDHSAGQYKDVTTNLRNSIQYFVFHNGELVKAGDSEFSSTNMEIIRDQVISKGFQLIGLAGKNYASYVESKGYNVISYQADICLVDLAGYLENLNLISEGSAVSIEDSFIPDDLPSNFKVR